eukprot:scaffold15163_cov166-Amphora_coffeaeformis.AAC.6
MRPHCRDICAEHCQSSGTTLDQTVHAKRTENALSDTSKHQQFGPATVSGFYILSYWANFEESGCDATPHTVEFRARLYGPIYRLFLTRITSRQARVIDAILFFRFVIVIDWLVQKQGSVAVAVVVVAVVTPTRQACQFRVGIVVIEMMIVVGGGSSCLSSLF